MLKLLVVLVYDNIRNYSIDCCSSRYNLFHILDWRTAMKKTFEFKLTDIPKGIRDRLESLKFDPQWTFVISQGYLKVYKQIKA